MSATILVVDDVPAMADQYAYDLRRVGGYETLIARGGAEALETLGHEAVDCVILDLEMPGTDGFAVLRALKERGLDLPVIVYTGTGSYDRCVQALRLGAYGFVDKAEPMERVVHEVETALERRRLIAEVTSMRRYGGGDSALLGESPAMQRLKEEIARVAPIPSPVLIVGESGSGKEVVAREVHRLGPGPKEPFVAVNSAALPESLVESELFGHERGAFTGAATTRKGAFESAGKGTIFLDEIGELPAQAQAKLLRVLEQREIVRVGSNRAIPVPARVVAATNRELAKEVDAGRFRRDLHYRLEVHVLRVPSLRERLSDVPELVEHLLVTTCARFGVRRKRASAEAMSVLMSYDWRRNNVRELRNVVERMIIATDGDEIGVGAVPADVRSAPSSVSAAAAGDGAGPRTFVELKAEAERRIVMLALERNEWHITRTARELGLADHASLLKIMRRHQIVRPGGEG
ncbi:MAG TPA: sigma-54 dependent transcriptional regulator [Gemmatimonadaceae bacterium]|nr:sigma-54 dependent transcriptional regulator [Gemmatimonadaceae bacterium]